MCCVVRAVLFLLRKQPWRFQEVTCHNQGTGMMDSIASPPHTKIHKLNRAETGLGPGTLLQCGSAYIWTHLSSNNKIQRNYVRLKITVCMHSWTNSGQKIQRDWKNPNVSFEDPGAKSGAKAGY